MSLRQESTILSILLSHLGGECVHSSDLPDDSVVTLVDFFGRECIHSSDPQDDSVGTLVDFCHEVYAMQDLVVGVGNIGHKKHTHGHVAPEPQRRVNARNGPFNLAHHEDMDSHCASAHQQEMPASEANSGMHADTEGLGDPNQNCNTNPEGWYEGGGLDHELDAENLRSYAQHLESAIADLNLQSPGFLESECADTTVEPSPAQASSNCSPLPEVITPLADMSTLVSPHLHTDAPASSSITQSQPQLVPEQSIARPLSEATRDHREKTPVHQQQVESENNAVAAATCGQDNTHLHPRDPDHAEDGSISRNSKAEASIPSPQEPGHVTDMAFHGHHFSQHDKKENHGCNTGSTQSPTSALHHLESSTRDRFQWKPPPELATGACSYRVTSSSPQSIHCPLPPNHSQLVEQSDCQGEQRGFRELHSHADRVSMPSRSTMSPNHLHSTMGTFKGTIETPGELCKQTVQRSMLL